MGRGVAPSLLRTRSGGSHLPRRNTFPGPSPGEGSSDSPCAAHTDESSPPARPPTAKMSIISVHLRNISPAEANAADVFPCQAQLERRAESGLYQITCSTWVAPAALSWASHCAAAARPSNEQNTTPSPRELSSTRTSCPAQEAMRSANSSRESESQDAVKPMLYGGSAQMRSTQEDGRRWSTSSAEAWTQTCPLVADERASSTASCRLGHRAVRAKPCLPAAVVGLVAPSLGDAVFRISGVRTKSVSCSVLCVACSAFAGFNCNRSAVSCSVLPSTLLSNLLRSVGWPFV